MREILKAKSSLLPEQIGWNHRPQAVCARRLGSSGLWSKTWGGGRGKGTQRRRGKTRTASFLDAKMPEV